jgi:hypothetical protein
MRSRPAPRHRGLFGLAAATLAVSLIAIVPAAAPAKTSSKLKLPSEQTSTTGNFFTLEAYDPPTKSSSTANFEMKVCTSDHTPTETEIVPEFFQATLSGGGSLAESPAIAKSPALEVKPLGKLQCVEGWLGFAVPHGKSISALVYIHQKHLTWSVG